MVDDLKSSNNLVPSFRSDKYQWFRARLQLDLLDIDNDLIEMPSLVQDAGECAAVANEIRDSAKEEFERTKANIAQQLRDSAIGKKPSETMIDSQLPLYELYKQVQAAWSQSRLDAALWATIVEAMRAKSAMIRVSADMLNSGLLTADFLRNKRRAEIRGALHDETKVETG